MDKYDKEIRLENKEYSAPFEGSVTHDIQNNQQDKEIENWKVPVGGSIGALPVIYNDKIYFGSCDKNFYCLSLDGKIIWKYLTGEPVLSSASVRNKTVFFGSDDSHLYALDAETGELKWKFKTGDSIYSSPAIVDERMYFGSNDGHLYALNLDGKLLWKFLTGGRITCSPGVANDAVFFNSYDKNFYSVSTDGNMIWKFPIGGVSGSSPTIANNKYEEIWGFQKHNSKEPKKLTADGGFVYFGSWNNHRYALNVENGKLVWQFITGGLTSSPSTIYDKTLYFGSWDTYFYALSAENGKLLWKTRTGGYVEQKPVVHDKMIYFGSMDQHMYALSLEGKMSWKFVSGGPMLSSPTIYKNIIYVGSWDTYFYAIDIKTHKILWKFQAGFPFMSPISDLVEKAVKVTEKRFTSWKPEIERPTLKSYKTEITEIRQNLSEKHAYFMKNKYTTENAYKDRK